jgi:hypothetical protein
MSVVDAAEAHCRLWFSFKRAMTARRADSLGSLAVIFSRTLYGKNFYRTLATYEG